MLTINERLRRMADKSEKCARDWVEMGNELKERATSPDVDTLAKEWANLKSMEYSQQALMFCKLGAILRAGMDDAT